MKRKMHGLRHAPEYPIWTDMKKRCYRPGNKDFKYYGARGIGVCDRWRNDFAAFLADVGPRPEGLTLDRIDCNKDYEPGNVRWASRKEQRWNRRDSHRAADGTPTCKHGHPWTPENIRPNGGGKFRCGKCSRTRPPAPKQETNDAG